MVIGTVTRLRIWAGFVLACVAAGAAAGYARPWAGNSPAGYAVAGGIGGGMGAIYARLAAQWLLSLRVANVHRWVWLSLQGGLVMYGGYIGFSDPAPGIPRALFVVFMAGFCALLALTLTVVWVLAYELVRYRFVPLVRRGAQQIQRRRAL